VINPTITKIISQKTQFISDNTCSKTNGGRVKVGDTAQVVVWQVTVRDGPGGPGIANIVGYLNRGRKMKILEGPICMNKYYFVRIHSEINSEGWVAEGDEQNYYIKPI
jgi:hypothetical protein